jgi:molybdopterin molybdotransferase
MIPLDQALAAYPASLAPLPPETLALTAALNRVLRAPGIAACDLPRHSQSALDGYVLTAEDAARAPCRLRIVDAVAAGDTRALQPLAPGECQRILTGARVPPGVTPDTGVVIAQERVRAKDGHIDLPGPFSPHGTNIRWQGEEARAGTCIADTGQRLTPGMIGSLAAAGVAQVSVTRRPRIAVLISGDELRPLGSSLEDGQIWDSNGPLVLSWLAARGYTASVQRLRDTRAAVDAMLDEALAHNDLVITTGGVSVGDKDFVIPAAESLGVQRVFWQVAQKPGKPLYFGRRSGTALLGLPGNPGAVLIGLTLHVRLAIDVLEGAAPSGAELRPGVLAAGVKADQRRESLLRMRLEVDAEGKNRLHPLPHQDSHMLSNLNSATVLARLPARQADYEPGEILRWTAL